MDTIYPEKGIVYSMLPFWSESMSFSADCMGNEVWTRIESNHGRFEFLLEHVREFFAGNLNEKTPVDSACIILKLKNDALPVKMFNNRSYWISGKPFNGSKSAEGILRLPVSLDPASFRLIYHPYTGIGMLIYSVELIAGSNSVERPTLNDFIRLNYLLRVYSRQDEAYFITRNDRIEEKSKAGQFLKSKFSPMFELGEEKDIIETGWRPRHLINYLLCELNHSGSLKFFNVNHFMPLIYFQSANEISGEDVILRALFYLRNVYDFDYSPSQTNLNEESDCLHPFRQIYYSASLEGAVVFNNSDADAPEFIKTFYNSSFKNSLWVFLLGLMQRSIFLQLMKEVSDVDPDDHLKIKEYLKRYTALSLKAIFSKISVFHQHNDFYDLIIKKLQINSLQTELGDELTDLNYLQRQFHEDEVERNDNIEKQHEKRLNFILFTLSVLSLAEVVYQVLTSPPIPVLAHIMAIGIPLGLGFAVWAILRLRKK